MALIGLSREEPNAFATPAIMMTVVILCAKNVRPYAPSVAIILFAPIAMILNKELFTIVFAHVKMASTIFLMVLLFWKQCVNLVTIHVRLVQRKGPLHALFAMLIDSI